MGTYGRIACQRSLALKDVMVNGEVLEPDFSGEVKVILVYYGSGTYHIRRGEVLATLICERAIIPEQASSIVEEVFGDQENDSVNR